MEELGSRDVARAAVTVALSKNREEEKGIK